MFGNLREDIQFLTCFGSRVELLITGLLRAIRLLSNTYLLYYVMSKTMNKHQGAPPKQYTSTYCVYNRVNFVLTFHNLIYCILLFSESFKAKTIFLRGMLCNFSNHFPHVASFHVGKLCNIHNHFLHAPMFPTKQVLQITI